MEIKLTTSQFVAEITIECGNARITEDLTILVNGEWRVDVGFIENLITVAINLNRFNGKNDVGFVKEIFERFLNDGERKELLEILN
jgi:hypothetical protein